MKPLVKPLLAAGLVIRNGNKGILSLDAFGGTFLRSFSNSSNASAAKVKQLPPEIITPKLGDSLLEILRGHGIEKILSDPHGFSQQLSFPIPSDIRKKVIEDSQDLLEESNHSLFEAVKNFSPQEGGGEKMMYLKFPQLPAASTMPVLYVEGFKNSSYQRKQNLAANSYYYLCFTEIMMAIAGFSQKPRGDINAYILHTNRKPEENKKEQNYDGTYHTDEPKPYDDMPNATALFCAKGNGTSTYILKTAEIIAQIDPKYLAILAGRFYYKSDSIYDSFQIYNPKKNELLIDTNIALEEIRAVDVSEELFKEAMTAALHAVVNTAAYAVTLEQGDLLTFARQIHARGEKIYYTPPLYTSLGITPFIIDPTKKDSDNIFRTLFATSYMESKLPNPKVATPSVNVVSEDISKSK